MLNDKTVDFLSDNIDCAIRVGAEVDPATVAVLLAEVPRSMVASLGCWSNTASFLILSSYQRCLDCREYVLST